MSTREDLPGDNDPPETPPQDVSPTAKRQPLRYTPAQIALARLMPAAIAGKWGSIKLAKEAGCDPATAKAALSKAAAMIRQNSEKALGIESQRLAVEARKARERALKRLDKLGAVVDSLTAGLQAAGKAADARDVGTAVKAAKDLWTHTEQLTGLDVAKSLAVKAGAGDGGLPVAWDGVGAISGQVLPLEAEALPAGE